MYKWHVCLGSSNQERIQGKRKEISSEEGKGERQGKWEGNGEGKVH